MGVGRTAEYLARVSAVRAPNSINDLRHVDSFWNQNESKSIAVENWRHISQIFATPVKIEQQISKTDSVQFWWILYTAWVSFVETARCLRNKSCLRPTAHSWWVAAEITRSGKT